MKLYETIYEITPMHSSLEAKEKKNTLCPYWISQILLPLLIPRGPSASPKKQQLQLFPLQHACRTTWSFALFVWTGLAYKAESTVGWFGVREKYCSLADKSCVGAESDQQVNICSFAVRYDRRWPSTEWHRVYTGLGNVPYVQFESVGDFISEPKCSKFAVVLQTRGSKMGGARGSVGL